jgi:hypothetical protein
MTVANDKAMIATLAKVRAQTTKAMDPTPAPGKNSIISGATGTQIQK